MPLANEEKEYLTVWFVTPSAGAVREKKRLNAGTFIYIYIGREETIS
jgi:IS4 transposase